VSNVSSSYAGTGHVRERLNAAWASTSDRAGPDHWGSSSGQARVVRGDPKDLLRAGRGVLLNRRPAAADRRTEFAETVKRKGKNESGKELAWRDAPRPGRGSAQHALITRTADSSTPRGGGAGRPTAAPSFIEGLLRTQ